VVLRLGKVPPRLETPDHIAPIFQTRGRGEYLLALPGPTLALSRKIPLLLHTTVSFRDGLTAMVPTHYEVANIACTLAALDWRRRFWSSTAAAPTSAPPGRRCATGGRCIGLRLRPLALA
jgi:hypothetical protein